jgi:feruloyl-CoA synthase
VKLIAAGDPLIQDAVITGHDRSEIAALVFLSPAAKGMDLTAKLTQILKDFSAEPSSSRITRLMVMSEPPSIDANEITDKGYMNQRAVLERRADLVNRLYSASEVVTTS